jgi:mannose-6-phosphate isomerase-like protein (cupin superfamily)
LSDPFFKRTEDCREIVAADECRLRELFHPDRDAPDLPYSLAVAFIERGAATAPHRLTEEDELYYFLEGHGSIAVGESLREVGQGDVVLVPRGVTQSVTNTGNGPLRWLNLVSPPWRLDHDRPVRGKI